MRLTQVLDALLAGDGLFRTLAGAGVGFGPLAANRQAAAMTHTAVTGDVAQSRDVLAHLAAKLALDRIVLVQERGQPGDFVFAEVASADRRVDARLVAQLTGDL